MRPDEMKNIEKKREGVWPRTSIKRSDDRQKPSDRKKQRGFRRWK